MRLFTGLDLAPHVIANIAKFIADVEGVHWVPLGNLHITTKFIGEWPASRLEELKKRLTFDARAFRLDIERLGFFPNAVWAGVAANADLAALVEATQTSLCGIGVAKGKRAYLPHVTLARMANPAATASLQAPATFGGFEARAFHLYESSNSVYTKLATFALK